MRTDVLAAALDDLDRAGAGTYGRLRKAVADLAYEGRRVVAHARSQDAVDAARGAVVTVVVLLDQAAALGPDPARDRTQVDGATATEALITAVQAAASRVASIADHAAGTIARDLHAAAVSATTSLARGWEPAPHTPALEAPAPVVVRQVRVDPARLLIAAVFATAAAFVVGNAATAAGDTWTPTGTGWTPSPITVPADPSTAGTAPTDRSHP
jgi:hypothetical protein